MSTSPDPIRLLIAGEFQQVAEDISHFSDYADEVLVCGVVHDSAAALEEARLQEPDVVLVNELLPAAQVLISQLRNTMPDVAILVIRETNKSKALASDLVAVPRNAAFEVWMQAIRKAAGREESAPGPEPETPPLDQPAEPSPAAAAEGESWEVADEAGWAVAPLPPKSAAPVPARSGKGKLFVVFSGKGGVGKSTIATNLAVALSGELHSHTALVDLDLQYGDSAIMLLIQNPQSSISDVTQMGDPILPENIEGSMVNGPEGVRVLTAPPSPEYADLVTAANVRAILRELMSIYDYVIVDCPAILEERVLEAIEIADKILLVAAFNVTAIKDAQITMRLFDSLGIEEERVLIIINQTQPKANFTVEEVEELLHSPVAARLPYENRIDESIDTGRPWIVMQPKSEVSKQLRRILHHIAPERFVSPMDPLPTARLQPGEPAAEKGGRRRFSLGRG